MILNQKKRIIRIINQEIKNLNLNLKGLNIITELGSNGYMFGPLIASLAGAKKVTTLTKDSFFGKSNEIIKSFRYHFPDESYLNKIETKIKLSDKDLIRADIITNTGFLRPLDSNIIDKLKSGVVIPLMYDKWEMRQDDIDVSACTSKNIKISGTNEDLDTYPIFDFCGILATKLALESGFEIRENKIIVWSSDNFGETIKNQFEKLGASFVCVTNNFQDVLNIAADLDFILISDYNETRAYGTDYFFDFNKLVEINHDVTFIHLFGELDYKKLKKNKINLYPPKNGYSKKMSFALDYLGIIPLIKLLTASFKVAECLIRGEKNDLVQEINCYYEEELGIYKIK